MDPITMMVASIGMQFFNNYANSKKNEEIQEKQREFQRAAAEHDFERMRKLQTESAKLALELEAEVHKERVEDINSNYDTLLDNFAHSFAIQNWPLNVLPFVMKGESFGTLFNGTKSINLHCILTPSNCDWFNKNFYDDIDLRLEAEMNNNWNAQSTHPIVYYGGAWNCRSMVRGISVPNIVDLDDIELLRVNLKDVPVVVITPYFDPWLHFKVQLWGMGKEADAPYRIDIPHGDEVEFSQRIFSYDYNKDEVDITEDFENTTVEEFVPYLECLVGFIADKYFWSMYGTSASLPALLCKNTNIAHSKEKYAVKYEVLLDNVSADNQLTTKPESIWTLFVSLKDILSPNIRDKCAKQSLNYIATNKGFTRFENNEELRRSFTVEDKKLILNIVENVPSGNIHDFFYEILQRIEAQIPCVYVAEDVITFVDILEYAIQISEDVQNNDISISISEDTIIIGVLCADKNNIISDEISPKCIVLNYKKLVIADRLKLRSQSFIIKGDKLESMYCQNKKLYENENF